MDAGRTVRLSNTSVVLGLILKSGPISVREISEEAGLSKVTTHAILQDLGERELVEVARHDHAKRGPAPALYAARADTAYAISASVDAEAAVAECVDLLGVSRAQARITGADPIENVVRAIREVERSSADTIVVGLPYALAGDAQRLVRELGRPADVRTNVELACRLEAAAQEAKTFVYASLDPEPAVAAVVAGRIYTGPTSLLAGSTLVEVVATTCAVFETPMVVGELGIPGRAGAHPAARGARALALSRLRQSVISKFPSMAHPHPGVTVGRESTRGR
jgi:DNA-binding IscR family transcriptional regulator